MDYQKLANWQKIPELKGLLDLSTPPKELFFCGNFDPEIFASCIGVVGSRKMTDYGSRVVEKIVPDLIFKNQTIISGFMYGVDKYAHQTCVDYGGKTVAVLGWGIDTKLTGDDLKLAKKIVESGGLLLSEWEAQKATPWTFPARNRIVAALSHEVIVVEAAQKSGSLITARIATKLKRKLWAVPGPITSRTCEGTNLLIASGKAQLWLGKSASTNLSLNEDPILALLDQEALGANEIARKLVQPVSQIGAQLSLLLLSGQVLEKGGKDYLADAS